MPELEAKIEFTAKCEVCGQELSCNASTDYRGKITIDVEPCEKCLEEAKDNGYEKGSADAERDHVEQG